MKLWVLGALIYMVSTGRSHTHSVGKNRLPLSHNFPAFCLCEHVRACRPTRTHTLRRAAWPSTWGPTSSRCVCEILCVRNNHTVATHTLRPHSGDTTAHSSQPTAHSPQQLTPHHTTTSLRQHTHHPTRIRSQERPLAWPPSSTVFAQSERQAANRGAEAIAQTRQVVVSDFFADMQTHTRAHTHKWRVR